MSLAGRRRGCERQHGQSGFTLVEVLAVVTILAMALAAVGTLMKPPADRTELKAATVTIASMLRDARTNAIVQRAGRTVLVDVDRRLIWYGTSRRTRLSQGIRLAVTSAHSQGRRNKVAGIKFYPNGSSSGATIRLYGSGQTNELRVNWLTGRVSQKTLSVRRIIVP